MLRQRGWADRHQDRAARRQSGKVAALKDGNVQGS